MEHEGGDGDLAHLSALSTTSLVLIPNNTGPCGGEKEKRGRD